MQNEKGFSLIELLIVIAILGIVSAIGYSYFDKDKYITKSDAMKLHFICNRGKSEAVKRNKKLFVGINNKNIDFYVDNMLIDSRYLDYFIIYTDSVDGGELGGKESPNIETCGINGTLPDTVCNECGVAPGCKEYDDWKKSFEPTEYEYIFSFNQLGITNEEILLQFEKDKKLINVIKISLMGYIKTVLYE